MTETLVIAISAKYGRDAYLELKDNKVIFDDSEGEYGPIEFELEQLELAIKEHKLKLKENA